jgi:hypothetical protein
VDEFISKIRKRATAKKPEVKPITPANDKPAKAKVAQDEES